MLEGPSLPSTVVAEELRGIACAKSLTVNPQIMIKVFVHCYDILYGYFK